MADLAGILAARTRPTTGWAAIASVLWRAGRWRGGRAELHGVVGRLEQVDAVAVWADRCAGRLVEGLSEAMPRSGRG